VHGALVRYRVMAYIVGTALLALTVIVICQFGFGLKSEMKTPEKIVAPIHGYLYILYLVAYLDLVRRTGRWNIGRILLVVVSGFIPFLAFVVEHRVTRQMEAEWAADAEAASVGPDPAPTGAGSPT
jgi:integral membrane protein